MISCEEQIGCKGESRDNHYDVVFTVDKSFTLPLGVAVTSVLMHNENIHIYVFIDEFNPGEKERLISTVEKFSVPLTIYYVDASGFKKFPIRGDWSVAVYFRFLAADVLMARCSRMLYVDADVICQGSLDDLFQMDLGEKAIAAVPDPTYLQNKDRDEYSRRIGHSGDGYFNAGIMLLDLQKWQDMNITENAMKMLDDDPEKYVHAQDQDVLNVLFANKVYWLPVKYNTRNNPADTYPADTALIHYSGSPKPWKEFYYSAASCSPFAEVKEQSFWTDEQMQPPVKPIEYRFMSRKYARLGNYGKWLIWQIKYIAQKIKN